MGGDLDKLLDFSFSVDDWMVYIKRFIDILNNFFSKLGIKLFEDTTSAVAPENTTAGE